MDRKEKIYAFMSSDGYVPLKEEELAVVLDVPQEDRELFSSMLADMEREGLILKSRKGRYITAQTAGGSIGVYSGSERGFGFVVLEREEDVFIPNKNTGGAMHGDRVLVPHSACHAYQAAGRRDYPGFAQGKPPHSLLVPKTAAQVLCCGGRKGNLANHTNS